MIRIDNEEEFKKAVEKIPDYKIKAEKVTINVLLPAYLNLNLKLNNSPCENDKFKSLNARNT